MTKRSHHLSRVLVCAYACNPGKGSEESVGFDTSIALSARGHQVVVLTQRMEAKDCVQATVYAENITFKSHDIPPGLTFIFSRLGKLGVEMSYLIWLLSARRVVRKLHHEIQFTSSQHVTYARYWMPSPLAVLSVPFVLGPVGGGESIPDALWVSLSKRGLVFETIRNQMRLWGERSQTVRSSVSTSALAIGNTSETTARLKHLGATKTLVLNSASLSDSDLSTLSEQSSDEFQYDFVSVGRMLEWKGFQLGLRAFAHASNRNAKYLLIGNGPFLSELMHLAESLDISDRVEFARSLPREEVFSILGSTRALIHPSMHESGGYVCLEAMASGCPVISLRCGGPGLFVDDKAGYPVFVGSLKDTVLGLATAMNSVMDNEPEHSLKRILSRKRVNDCFSMRVKAEAISQIHNDFCLDHSTSGSARLQEVDLAITPPSRSSRIIRKSGVASE